MSTSGYLLLFLPALVNLWAIWHVLIASKLQLTPKVIWVAFLIFIPVLAGIAYFFGSYLRQKKV